MNRQEQEFYMIDYLIKEGLSEIDPSVVQVGGGREFLLTALLNARNPYILPSDEFLDVQNDYLQNTLIDYGLKFFEDLESAGEMFEDIYIGFENIAAFKCDFLVNEACRTFIGCPVPYHDCTDNWIHTFAGFQLKYECQHILDERGGKMRIGDIAVTYSYNLFCNKIIHVVGPVVYSPLSPYRQTAEKKLAKLYENCLICADENSAENIVFPCLSTGYKLFPPERSIKIAIDSFIRYKSRTGSKLKIALTSNDSIIYDAMKKVFKEY